MIAGLEDLPIHADAAADHIDERLGASGNEMLKRRLLQRGKIDVGIHIEGKRKALRGRLCPAGDDIKEMIRQDVYKRQPRSPSASVSRDVIFPPSRNW